MIVKGTKRNGSDGDGVDGEWSAANSAYLGETIDNGCRATNWGEDGFGRVEETFFGYLEESGCEREVRPILVVESGRSLLITVRMMEVVRKRKPPLSERI